MVQRGTRRSRESDRRRSAAWIGEAAEAVVRGLLSAGSEATWMAMIRSRNLTSRTYNPALAREIAE